MLLSTITYQQKSLLLLLTRINQPEQTRNYQQEIINQKNLQEYQQLQLQLDYQ